MKKSLDDIEKKHFTYLIKILSSAVNETSAPVPDEGINWRKMISFASKCSIEAIFANTVLSLSKEKLPPSEICDILNQIIAKELLIDGNLSYEVERLLKVFDKHKIKNLPLKGYFMKKEYSRSDFRSVSDFDILFDINQLNELNDAFSELGYTFIHNDDNQYHYMKKPVMYVEMHSTLVHEDESYFPYLKDQLQHSTKRGGYNYSYEMSCEDYYVYMLVHNSNHFRIGGMGIRMMLDTYLYYNNHKNDFDYDYLKNRLALLKLDKFENRIRNIAFNWFSSDKPIISFDNIETYILLSGTLGRLDVGVMINSLKALSKDDNSSKRKSKLFYLLSSLFPPKSSMEIDYKYLQKLPVLLPVSWVHMWFKRFFVYKNVHIKRGIQSRMNYNDDDVNYYLSLIDEVGFKNFGIRNNN